MLLQVFAVPLVHGPLITQRLSLFENLGEFGAGLIEFRVGLGKLVMSLCKLFRFRLLSTDLCALTFQIFFQLSELM